MAADNVWLILRDLTL